MTFSLRGCVKGGEQHLDAPDTGSVALDFSLDGGGNFAEKITSVNVGIFDGEGNYLRTERVGHDDISAREGMNLALDPGEYRLIFWGNLEGEANLTCNCKKCNGKTVDPGNACRMGKCGRNLRITGEAGDLYYASGGEMTTRGKGCGKGSGKAQEYYPLTVDGKGQTHEIVFTPAYRSLGVLIKGLPADKLPDVVFERLPAGLNYSGMEPSGETVSLSRHTKLVKANGTEYAAATFNTFRFDDGDNVEMVVSNEGKELFRTPLAEALSGSTDADLSTGIVLDFTGLNVTVTVQDWTTVNMDVILCRHKQEDKCSEK